MIKFVVKVRSNKGPRWHAGVDFVIGSFSSKELAEIQSKYTPDSWIEEHRS